MKKLFLFLSIFILSAPSAYAISLQGAIDYGSFLLEIEKDISDDTNFSEGERVYLYTLYDDLDRNGNKELLYAYYEDQMIYVNVYNENGLIDGIEFPLSKQYIYVALGKTGLYLVWGREDSKDHAWEAPENIYYDYYKFKNNQFILETAMNYDKTVYRFDNFQYANMESLPTEVLAAYNNGNYSTATYTYVHDRSINQVQKSESEFNDYLKPYESLDLHLLAGFYEVEIAAEEAYANLSTTAAAIGNDWISHAKLPAIPGTLVTDTLDAVQKERLLLSVGLAHGLIDRIKGDDLLGYSSLEPLSNEDILKLLTASFEVPDYLNSYNRGDVTATFSKAEVDTLFTQLFGQIIPSSLTTTEYDSSLKLKQLNDLYELTGLDMNYYFYPASQVNAIYELAPRIYLVDFQMYNLVSDFFNRDLNVEAKSSSPFERFYEVWPNGGQNIRGGENYYAIMKQPENADGSSIWRVLDINLAENFKSVEPFLPVAEAVDEESEDVIVANASADNETVSQAETNKTANNTLLFKVLGGLLFVIGLGILIYYFYKKKNVSRNV